jgi:hypothetical protein
MVARFGDIPIVEGDWEVLGVLTSWDRDEWPSSRFVRADLSGHTYVVEYHSRDPNKVLAERGATQAEVDTLPDDGLHGYIIIRNRLSKVLLADSWQGPVT